MFKRKKRRSREFKKNSQVIDFEEAREERRKKRQTVADRKAESQDAGRRSSETERKRPNQKNKVKRRIYAAICCVIIAVVGFSLYNIVDLKLQQREIIAQNEALKKEKKELSEELKNADNPEYIEEQARTQLRLIKPGEILYIMPEDLKKAGKKAATPPAVAPPLEQEVTNEAVQR